jgi:pimeloyl-ACP methyl ester carboxylesterase
VLIVPGYGMNSFIFGFHPRGASLEGYLVESGFEVWRVDLRDQGESERAGGTESYSLESLALTDLAVAIDAVLANTDTRGRRADIIGASLGGTLMFMHAVMRPGHRMGALVSMGGPVRWVNVHPLLKFLFGSPRIAGWVRFSGTRALAERALPHLARRAPWLLRIYLNPDISDVTAVREMVKTVEDPNRFVNRQIAEWIRDRDLRVEGVNLSDALTRITEPLMCVVANADGIVPPETALFPLERVRSAVKTRLEVGDGETAVAHADLFISNESQRRVFAPIADWLREQNDRGTNRTDVAASRSA